MANLPGKWIKRGFIVGIVAFGYKALSTFLAAQKLETSLQTIKYTGSIESPARFDVTLRHANPTNTNITLTGLSIKAFYKSASESETLIAQANIPNPLAFAAGKNTLVKYPIKGEDLDIVISLIDTLLLNKPTLKVQVSGNANGIPFSITQNQKLS